MEMFLKEYLAHIKLEKNLSKNTISSYKNDITAFISYLKNKGKEDPSIISSNDIGGFFKTLNELGLSGSSSARYFSSLKGFFLYLLKNKYILKNPIEKITAPKIAKRLPGVLDV
ncbi:MAG: xerD, partial [Ignavibacteriaceae bacterium]|nr:xerD [Ignavibacteriaceae bacterium]